MRVPKIYWDITTTKVLTMEFIEGTKINEITRKKHKGIFKPKEVAEKGAKAILMDKQEAVQRLLNASKKDVPLSIPEIKIKHLIALINISEKAHSVITNKALRIRALESVLRDAQIFIEDPNPKEVETFYKIKNKIKFALLK